MSESETNAGSSIEQSKQFIEVESVPFSKVERGSQFLVYTKIDNEPIEEQVEPNYKIEVIGIRKGGLRVQVVHKINNEYEEFIARTPGGYRAALSDDKREALRKGRLPYELGITPGIIQQANSTVDNCLYFENLKDLLTGEKISKSRRTSVIVKILFKQ